jgi:uncharacterized zinc-type alcohol dehydrogenase-like protein
LQALRRFCAPGITCFADAALESEQGQKVGVIGPAGSTHGREIREPLGRATVPSPRRQTRWRMATIGADEVVRTTNPAEIEKHAESFNFILDTASAEHNIGSYLPLLKLDGTFTLVGAPPKPFPIAAFQLIPGRHSLAGSGIGGIRETQEMLDFCADKGITADIEMTRFSRSMTRISGWPRATGSTAS